MPVIRVELFPGRSLDQKRQFAEAVTKSFVKICGGSADGVHIIFADISKENWASAGRLAVDPEPAASDTTGETR